MAFPCLLDIVVARRPIASCHFLNLPYPDSFSTTAGELANTPVIPSIPDAVGVLCALPDLSLCALAKACCMHMARGVYGSFHPTDPRVMSAKGCRRSEQCCQDQAEEAVTHSLMFARVLLRNGLET